MAEAAAIHEGKHASQVQDYGPAARGDSSKTDVVISDETILYPKCSQLDLLVALSQRAYDKNKAYLKEGGRLIVDSNNVWPEKRGKTHKIPMTEIARDLVGSSLSVNMVALGAIAALDGLAELESIKKSMLERVPPATAEKNLAALMAGYDAAMNKKNKNNPSKRKKSRMNKE